MIFSCLENVKVWIDCICKRLYSNTDTKIWGLPPTVCFSLKCFVVVVVVVALAFTPSLNCFVHVLVGIQHTVYVLNVMIIDFILVAYSDI